MPIFVLIIILAVLSLLQRIVPWVLYKRFKPGAVSQRLFDIVAVAAFASLMVYNMNSFHYQDVLPLVPAFIVAFRTGNIGLSILVGMAFALALTVL